MWPRGIKGILLTESAHGVRRFCISSSNTVSLQSSRNNNNNSDNDLSCLTIGRSLLPGFPEVSHAQCRVAFKQHIKLDELREEFVLEDLQSANGTWLNDERVKPGQIIRLGPGDQIGFGSKRDAEGNREGSLVTFVVSEVDGEHELRIEKILQRMAGCAHLAQVLRASPFVAEGMFACVKVTRASSSLSSGSSSSSSSSSSGSGFGSKGLFEQAAKSRLGRALRKRGSAKQGLLFEIWLLIFADCILVGVPHKSSGNYRLGDSFLPRSTRVIDTTEAVNGITLCSKTSGASVTFTCDSASAKSEWLRVLRRVISDSLLHYMQEQNELHQRLAALADDKGLEGLSPVGGTIKLSQPVVRPELEFSSSIFSSSGESLPANFDRTPSTQGSSHCSVSTSSLGSSEGDDRTEDALSVEASSISETLSLASDSTSLEASRAARRLLPKRCVIAGARGAGASKQSIRWSIAKAIGIDEDDFDSITPVTEAAEELTPRQLQERMRAEGMLNDEEPGFADEVLECVAIADNFAESSDDLAFSKGDIVVVIEQDPSGCWMGTAHGRVGQFASTKVAKCADDFSMPSIESPSDSSVDLSSNQLRSRGMRGTTISDITIANPSCLAPRNPLIGLQVPSPVAEPRNEESTRRRIRGAQATVISHVESSPAVRTSGSLSRDYKWLIPLEELENVQASATSSNACTAEYRATQVHVCVIFSAMATGDMSNDHVMSQWAIQVNAAATLRPNPNVAAIIGAVAPVSCFSGYAAVVTDAGAFTLFEWLRVGPGSNATDDFLATLLRGISRGLLHLHCEKVVARVLSSVNVFVDSSGGARIAGMLVDGWQNVLLDGSTLAKACAECRWCSPESLVAEIYDSASDMWSLGCIAAELVARASPFNSLSDSRVEEIADGIIGGSFNPAVELCDEPRSAARTAMISVAREATHFEPAKRIDAKYACQLLARAY